MSEETDYDPARMHDTIVSGSSQSPDHYYYLHVQPREMVLTVGSSDQVLVLSEWFWSGSPIFDKDSTR